MVFAGQGPAMIREAGPGDRKAIEALMMRRIDGAMFPLSNLRAHGLGEGNFASDHDQAIRVWHVGQESLIALTRRGMLLPLLVGEPDLGNLRGVLAGVTVTGAIGPAASVRPVLAALDLTDHPMLKDEDEPGFALDLADLRVHDRSGAVLVPATAERRPMLVDWRTAYHGEVLGTPAAEAPARAAMEIDGYIARDSHRVLMLDGQPVAMTGFNARLPEIVQVGAVYTPPYLRNKGYARLAVALHLAEAREAGTRRAVLFAASDAAARAYQAIGFQPTFAFALVLFSSPTTVTT
jgi:RimJ/RimL family protein N-acetyltransferase